MDVLGGLHHEYGWTRSLLERADVSAEHSIVCHKRRYFTDISTMDGCPKLMAVRHTESTLDQVELQPPPKHELLGD